MTKLQLILELNAQDAVALTPEAFKHRVMRLSAAQRIALANDMINHLDMRMEECLQRLQEIHIALNQGEVL
ncbi:hypothetical protein [Vibrio metschnikovii]|uniref:hypothetical protein n=1 Tax=Vibrio metschnikovii TaxID=28172 RepID=UPI001C2F655C|nr:hypothetical protein [Vibrio metschnikovii]